MQEDLFMDSYKDQILDTLFDLVKIPSFKGEAEEGAPFGQGPKDALIKFLEITDSLGFRTKNVDNYAGYAEFGPNDPSLPMIAVVCHLDVVPADGWDDAFEPRLDEDGDTVIGRGTVDDKGPAVSILYAMKSLMDEGYEPKCRIRFIFGTDEESGSECLQYYTKHEEIPVAAFTADADFPVINAEKGQVKFDLVWDKMEARPQDGQFKLLSAKCGSKSNVVPGEATLVFQDKNSETVEVETLGNMGHASTPEMYKNAIQYALADAHAKAKVKNAEDVFLNEFMEVLNTEYNGESLGVALTDEPSGDLTLNVGLFSLDQNEARLTIDIRYPVTYTTEDVIGLIEENIQSTSFRIENVSESVPLYRPAEDPLVKLLMDSYNEVTGEDESPKGMGGGTYARHLPNTIAFGANFPENPYLGHAKFEYARLSDIVRASEIFRISIQRMDDEYSL